MAVDRVNVLRC